ncbi:MAG: hypothetical protein HDR88_16430 [Bacteroides sp.]|nr:hypothetical protein [Bacteroides sp.]
MKIVVAPHIPIIANEDLNTLSFLNLCLLDLPRFIDILVPENWEDILNNNISIASSFELAMLMRKLNVVKFPHQRKAEFIRLNPNLFVYINPDDTSMAQQQLFALAKCVNARRVYAGLVCDVEKFDISFDKSTVTAINFNPEGTQTLLELFNSYRPKLEQLKHYHEARKRGDKDVSPFSAYDKNDDKYARELLQQAFEDYNGDVDDRTYLYTYDKKYKTFVQFRPGRNNIYHGMDINLKTAKDKAPEIVKKYNK